MEERTGKCYRNRTAVAIVVLAVVIGLALFLALPRQAHDEDGALREMISQVDESAIYQTTYRPAELLDAGLSLPGERTGRRVSPRPARRHPWPEGGVQSETYRNVIATLPGQDPASDELVIVGAHFDSTSSTPGRAPGATDNGGGVAIVLELARVMSMYQFNHTVQFAFWNAEEDSMNGSREYVAFARENALDIPLYMNSTPRRTTRTTGLCWMSCTMTSRSRSRSYTGTTIPCTRSGSA